MDRPVALERQCRQIGPGPPICNTCEVPWTPPPIDCNCNLLVMAWQAKSLTVGTVEVLLALLGIGFGPAAPLAMVSLQNTVAVHHLGAAVGTLGFMRNLYATMPVAVFGAIVLAGTGDTPAILPRGALGNVAIPVEGFSHIFFLIALRRRYSPPRFG
jgi:hypothetical protein